MWISCTQVRVLVQMLLSTVTEDTVDEFSTYMCICLYVNCLYLKKIKRHNVPFLTQTPCLKLIM